MTRPTSRRFIGPLTPAQQERRRLARYRWNDISEAMYDYNCTFREALDILKRKRENRFGMAILHETHLPL